MDHPRYQPVANHQGSEDSELDLPRIVTPGRQRRHPRLTGLPWRYGDSPFRVTGVGGGLRPIGSRVGGSTDDRDRRQFTEMGGAPQAKPLDEATAIAILRKAGGDKELARRIARQRGFNF